MSYASKTPVSTVRPNVEPIITTQETTQQQAVKPLTGFNVPKRPESRYKEAEIKIPEFLQKK